MSSLSLLSNISDTVSDKYSKYNDLTNGKKDSSSGNSLPLSDCTIEFRTITTSGRRTKTRTTATYHLSQFGASILTASSVQGKITLDADNSNDSIKTEQSTGTTLSMQIRLLSTKNNKGKATIEDLRTLRSYLHQWKNAVTTKSVKKKRATITTRLVNVTDMYRGKFIGLKVKSFREVMSDKAIGEAVIRLVFEVVEINKKQGTQRKAIATQEQSKDDLLSKYDKMFDKGMNYLNGGIQDIQDIMSSVNQFKTALRNDIQNIKNLGAKAKDIERSFQRLMNIDDFNRVFGVSSSTKEQTATTTQATTASVTIKPTLPPNIGTTQITYSQLPQEIKDLLVVDETEFNQLQPKQQELYAKLGTTQIQAYAPFVNILNVDNSAFSQLPPVVQRDVYRLHQDSTLKFSDLHIQTQTHLKEVGVLPIEFDTLPANSILRGKLFDIGYVAIVFSDLTNNQKQNLSKMGIDRTTIDNTSSYTVTPEQQRAILVCANV